MPSTEFTDWMALMDLEAEEARLAAEKQRQGR